MRIITTENSARQTTVLQSAKKIKTNTQPQRTKGSACLNVAPSHLLAEQIRQSQNGDTDATMALISAFDPLLEREAKRLTEQNLFPEKSDAKNEAITNFLDLIGAFRLFEADDNQIAGFVKKYLHDIRINLLKSNSRHCPDCHYVDFEKELEEDSPYSRFFPRCELRAEEKLEREFITRALLKSMQILTRKEEFAVKKIILENKPPSSVAKELHCSTRYLRRLKQRSLAKMRIWLETHYPTLRAN